jgi:hypothetical protein
LFDIKNTYIEIDRERERQIIPRRIKGTRRGVEKKKLQKKNIWPQDIIP